MSTLRFTGYNLLGTGIPTVVALITIPFYIGLIGDARYGVMSIVWIFLGYFGLFDFGIGRAVTQRIASLETLCGRTISKVFWTGLLLNTTLGVIGGLVLWPVAEYFFSHHFKVELLIKQEIMACLHWMLLALPLATITSVLNGTLQGSEKFLYMNFIHAIGSILFLITPLIVAWKFTVNLEYVLPAAVLSRLVGVLVLFCCCIKVLPTKQFLVSFYEAKRLFSYGGWVAISSFISPIMVMADRFLIASVLGAKSVAYYSVPYQLAERSTIFSTALCKSLFPRFAKISEAESHRISYNYSRLLICLVTPIMFIAILLSDWVVSQWITEEFALQSSGILAILLVGFWVNGLAGIPLSMLQASGRPSIVALCHCFELLPFIVLLYYSVEFAGLTGAAVAFSVRAYVDYLLLSYFAGILKRNALIQVPGLILLIFAVWLSVG